MAPVWIVASFSPASGWFRGLNSLNGFLQESRKFNHTGHNPYGRFTETVDSRERWFLTVFSELWEQDVPESQLRTLATARRGVRMM